MILQKFKEAYGSGPIHLVVRSDGLSTRTACGRYIWQSARRKLYARASPALTSCKTCLQTMAWRGAAGRWES